MNNMDQVDVFYLVRETEYNKKLSLQPQLNELLEELPVNQERKVRKVLDYLQSNGISWNCYGLTTTQVPEILSSFYILEYVKHAVNIDKKEPLYFNDFLRYLKRIKAPIKLFCKKIQRRIDKVGNDEHPKTENQVEKEEQEDTYSFI